MTRCLRLTYGAALVFLGTAGFFTLAEARQVRYEEIRIGALDVAPVRGSIYMITGAGGNIAISLGPRDGILVVNSGKEEMADQVLGTIAGLVERLNFPRPMPADPRTWYYETQQMARPAESIVHPIRYILNTNALPHETGGNLKLAARGESLTGGEERNNPRAAIVAHEGVPRAMATPPAGRPSPPSGAWPSETYFTKHLKLWDFFNGEGVQLIHVPAASTNGDSLVWFRNSDVIVAGDVFRQTGYPIIDIERGGHIEGIIKGLNLILDLAVPETFQEGGTMIIPGHGRLCNEADVVEYRNMVVMIRDRVQALIKKGMTLDQVKAAKPSFDYDGRYGATSGFWTTEMFIEAVYKNLSE